MSRKLLWSRALHRLMHVWFLLSRPMTLGVRAVVYDADRDAVLLVRHTYVSGFHLPGGGVEPGETMEDALERELREEGRVVPEERPKLVSIHLNRQACRRDHVAVYLVTRFRSLGPVTANREIAEAGFYPLDALPPETTAGTRRRLAEIFDRQEPAATW